MEVSGQILLVARYVHPTRVFEKQVAQSKNSQHNEKLHLYLLATSAEQLLEILAHPSATPFNAAKVGVFGTAYTWLMHSQLPPTHRCNPPSRLIATYSSSLRHT